MAKPEPSIAPALKIEPAGFFAFRTPLLPFDELTAFSMGLRAPSADPAALESALAEDRALLRARLREWLARPEVLEALFVASPSLHESLPAWLEAPDGERGQKVEKTLVRYFARMASRPTPFGLFAGCSVGTLGAVTRLTVEARSSYQRHTRLDGDYLAALTEALSRDPAVRRAVTWRPNSSLYRAAGRIRYAELRLQGKVRSYHLVAVEPTDFLEATLARAGEGASLDTLAEALVDEEVTREEADEFVQQLVDSQLIVSDLSPQVTGPEPIHELIDQLRAHPVTTQVAAVLDGTRADLAALDAAPLGVSLDGYRAVAAKLQELPAEVELSRLFQVDLVKPAASAMLGPEPLAEIVRGIELLRRISGGSRNDLLSRFREAFNSRYEGREVALTEVLDAEVGIGFDRSKASAAEVSPLIDGLAFDGEPAEETAPVGARYQLLLEKLTEALRTGAQEISLDDEDATALERKERAPVPDSFAAMATIAGESEDALAAGRFDLWLHFINGPSGANLLGRFCHGDERLLGHVRQHLRDEEAQQEGVLYAEVVHLPAGRVGNVLLRPLLREHEIVYLGRSGAPRDKQILVEDLTISIPPGGRVVLRSRRLGREVVPRLTAAHAFSNPHNLGVYQFLCALACQDDEPPGWSWGALEHAPFLPRVRAGRLILSLASWRLAGKELKELSDPRGQSRYAQVQALRARHQLPRWVAVADGDHVLPVDLDSTLSIDTFVQLVKDRPAVKLTELFATDRLCARGPEGRFVHEIVVPFLARRDELRRPSLPSPSPTVPRLLPPGSDWLYMKLYCGSATADQLLRDTIQPVVQKARDSGAAQSWFFIRYGDPEWHLRVRFRGAPERLTSEVLPQLAAAAQVALANGQVWKTQLDSYDRELYRYGGDEGILLSEELFCADSDACLAIVDTLSGDDGLDARWRLCLRGMDMLLDDLGLDATGKHELLRRVRAGFAQEFRVDGPMEKQLGDKFRKERLALEALLDPSNDAGSELEPGFDILKARSEKLRPISERLRAARLTLPIVELAPSYLHMHANRLLRSAARAQELVIYDFLERIYQGRAARARRAGPSSSRL
jgi:thiopeptide-type bacteriocin biosynthesis protein